MDHDPEEPSLYAESRLKDALAADERVNQLDIQVQIIYQDVVLSGSVNSAERRDAITAVAHEILPSFNIRNHVDVIELTPPAEMPSVGAIRVAAAGDLHFGLDSSEKVAGCFDQIDGEADILLLAGDLTRHGTVEEAAVLVKEVQRAPVPVVAVLGNHDYHSNMADQITDLLSNNGIAVLEGSNVSLDIRGTRVGIAGTKGFGGGFAGKCGSEFGEQIQKDFIAYTRSLANGLRVALEDLDTDIRIAMTHFAPVDETLSGEPLEIYPWLGSYLLGEAIDHAGCDWVFHGHAHAGNETGKTPAGIPVRNVAQPVIRAPYKIYCIEAAVEPVH